MVCAVGVITHVPTFEFLTWSATLGSMGYTMSRTYLVLEAAEAHAGPIKRSTILSNNIPRNGRRFDLSPLMKFRLALIGRTIGRFLPPIAYWVSTFRRGWGKGAWESRWSLPVPTRRTGFLGLVTKVNVGRVNWPRAVAVLLAVGLEFFQYNVVKTLGDQFNPIGVRQRPRLVEDGAFRVVRHPMYRFVFGSPFRNLQPSALIHPGFRRLAGLLLPSSYGRLHSGLGFPSTFFRSASPLISSRFPSRYLHDLSEVLACAHTHAKPYIYRRR